VRKIPAVLAVLGLAAVGLAGCSLPAGHVDCSRPVTDTAATDLVTVSGDVGAEPDVSVRTPFHVESTSFDDLEVGTGPALSASNQAVVLDLQIVSGETGEVAYSSPYDGDLSRVATTAAWAQSVPAFESALECATEGSRVVVALEPGGIEPEAAASLGLTEDESAVAVVDVQKVYLPRAQGSLVYNDALGLPTVVRAPDGRPGVIVPSATPPAELVVQTLIKGDGAEVTGERPVRVHYTGVTWAGQEVFDSSWDTQPASLSLEAVVPGFAQAVEGATVGSQLLVVIPPELGYGDTAQGEIPAGSTLVFVIDILGLDQAPTG
jgi:hypothetical protein